MDPLLTKISEHLSFLGYANPPVPNLQPDSIEIINAVHATKMPFWVFPFGGGAFFRALYNPSHAATNDPASFHTFVNDLNATIWLARYYVIQPYLSCAAWYYGDYEQRRFGIFIDRYFFENTLPHRQFRDRAELFLGPAQYV